MNSEQLAAVLEATIPLAGGVIMTLVGFRIVGKKQGESLPYDRWLSTYGWLFRIGGPILIVFGVFLTIIGISQVE